MHYVSDLITSLDKHSAHRRLTGQRRESPARIKRVSMGGWALLLATAGILILPRLWLPSRVASQRDRPKPEIRGMLRIAAAINALYCVVWHQLKAEQKAPLPATGPAILISNHTCGIDHLLLQAASDRVLGFMVAREYYEWKWVNWLARTIGCIPVNRDGRDLSATRAAIRGTARWEGLADLSRGDNRAGVGSPARRNATGICVSRNPRTGPGGTGLHLRHAAYQRDHRSDCQSISSGVYFGPAIDLSDINSDQAGDKEIQVEVSCRFRAALLALQARALSAEMGDLR